MHMSKIGAQIGAEQASRNGTRNPTTRSVFVLQDILVSLPLQSCYDFCTRDFLIWMMCGESPYPHTLENPTMEHQEDRPLSALLHT